MISRIFIKSRPWQLAMGCFILFLGILQAHAKPMPLTFLVVQEQKDSLKVTETINQSRQIHYNGHNKQEEYAKAKYAVSQAIRLGDTLLYARALDNLGLLHRYHQQFPEAIDLHIRAFNLIKDQETNALYKMIFANNAGVASRYHQQYGLAISYYMKALKIAERKNDRRNIAIANNGIGNALSKIPGREEEALSYYQTALTVEKQRNNTLGIAMNYLSISDYYIYKNQFNKAQSYLDKLLKINTQRNDAYGLAMTYQFYGKNYLKAGKYQKAETSFKNALNRFRKMNNEHKQSEILAQLGKVQLQKKNYPQAQKAYQEALNLAKKTDHRSLIMNSSYQLAKIYEIENKPAQALKHLKLANVYEDSIKLSEQKIQIASLVREYDLEKKENFIQLLQKDKALQQTLLENQQQKLNRRHLFIIFMGLGILFIIATAFLIYRNIQIKRKSIMMVQKEEQEKIQAVYDRNLAQAEILSTRLQINPHFLFNSLNAIKYLIQSEQNQRATKYLVVFSRYTRMVLETSKKLVVPLTEELQLTQYYLILETNRFEKDFTYQINDFDENAIKNAIIPPLLLQPFIENAIWHGLLPSKREKKELHLFVVPEAGSIKIIIDDNGVGREYGRSRSNKKLNKSMGMQITRDRIALYNESHTSKISCNVIDKTDSTGEAAGTQVVIQLMSSEKWELQKENPEPENRIEKPTT